MGVGGIGEANAGEIVCRSSAATSVDASSSANDVTGSEREGKEKLLFFTYF